MKKIFTILLSLLICATATAQVENSIVIDIASLRAVQQDALTGVNIDPIGLDSSRNPCARIKMKVERMTREEIDGLEVKLISNNQLTRCATADYENGLILEMTAKANTRFYLHHNDFGDSNEINLNLEGNKEYYIEALLNQQYSITVASNIADANVYLDQQFKGRTDRDFILTVKDVLPGDHTLMVEYGGIKYQQAITVNANSIFFRQMVDTQASKPQYVVFAVEPTNAVVTINGTLYTLQDGAMQVVLENGAYNYTVSASGYHSQSGSFTVSGSKVEKIITLTADVATVTITAPEGAEIWVNNIMKGNGRWSGTLAAGTYIFEARKAGHRTTSITRQISSKEQNQSYTLPAPTPIYGTLLISGTPIMADVTLDGNAAGRTPLELSNVLVGNHTLVVSKVGYNSQTQTVNVTEGKTTTANISLTKQTPPASATVVTPSSQIASGKGIYKVGDYYNDGVKEGVVFEVSADGRSGKILNLQQAPGKVVWAADKAEQKRLIGVKYTDDGQKNTNIVKAISGWQAKYPSFNWCVSLGNEWYMPAKEEVEKFVLDEAVRNAINATIEAKGGVKIVNRGDLGWYWTSTETNRFYDGSYGAIHIRTSDGYVGTYYKHGAIYVRAVAKFGSGNSSYTPAPTSTPMVSGNFKVGDIYDDGVKRGVIFEINGNTAKIVSLKKSANMVVWAVGSEAKRNIAATSTADGEANFEIVKQIADWRTKYPAFAWCANLGEGWYLPAKGELETIQQNKSLIEPHMIDKLDINFYFSSTESYTEEGGMKCVYDVGMKNGGNLKSRKSYHSYAIAVAKVRINNSSSSSTTYLQSSSKVYRVGDLYNENGKKGVVFEVDATGRHGKIISIECSPELMWATGAEQSKFIGATDIYDGQKNMDVVKQISGWQSKYPLFYWCANLGSGWYLPAKEEWTKIYRLRSSLESKLSRKLDTYFWSSTENNEVYKNQYCAWNISMGDHSTYCKDRTNIAFAVAKF